MRTFSEWGHEGETHAETERETGRQRMNERVCYPEGPFKRYWYHIGGKMQLIARGRM